MHLERGAPIDALWIARLRMAAVPARRQVIVVPHSGAGPSAYAALSRSFPADINVYGIAFPGRERRATETPISDADLMVRAVRRTLNSLPKLPTSLIGHSLGALIVAAVTPDVVAQLDRVVLSGTGPAGTLSHQVDHYSDRALLQLLRDIGGTRPELLDDPESRGMILRALRSDLVVGAALARRCFPSIRVSTVALAGRNDSMGPPAEVARWASVASGPFETFALPGGHFFLLDPSNAPAVVRALDPASRSGDKLSPYDFTTRAAISRN